MTPVPWPEWLKQNQPAEDMLWKDSARSQFHEIEHTAVEFGAPTVVSTHRSKSIVLPVVQFTSPRGYAQIRDNYYNLNVAIVWNFAPRLAFADVYGPPRPWAWYLGKIADARGYPPSARSADNGLTDGSWYEKYAGDRLFFDGPMNQQPNAYVAAHCFAEGMISRPLWEPEASEFMVASPSWDHARILMRKVWNAYPPREESP